MSIKKQDQKELTDLKRNKPLSWESHLRDHLKPENKTAPDGKTGSGSDGQKKKTKETR